MWNPKTQPATMKQLLFLCLLFSVKITNAQRELNNPLIDSKEVLKKGAELYSHEKYKEALKEYLKVPPSDTGYADVLNEIILCYYRDSSYAEAEKYIREAQSRFPEKNVDWYNLMANVYDDSKRAELAIKTYDSMLVESPYNYIAYFNKGISYFRLEKYEEAKKSFQQCIMLNPYYSSAHYYLGKVSLVKGNLVQALFSFAANLLVEPGNRNRKSTISYLSMISSGSNELNDYINRYKPGKEDDFDAVQEIIISKIALDKKYKLKASLEDQIVRQLQVAFEKTEFNANDKGFWMQYYAPLYKKIWDDGQFEPFVFYMFSEVDIKPVKDYIKSEKKTLKAFEDNFINYLNQIRTTQEISFNKRDKAITNYYIKNYAVTGKGAYGRNSKNEEVVTGPWEFYYPNGKIKSKGVFNAEGDREGEWVYYYETGILKERSVYKNGKANGKSESWFSNGLPYSITNYLNDEIDGIETLYFYNGMLKSVIPYRNGKKEGLAKYYNINDYLRTETVYVNDMQEGIETTYHQNRKIESTLNYTKDKANGEYKEYYDNGKIKITGNYIENEKTGEWKSFYKDGTAMSVENYLKGQLDGEYSAWHKNGKIQTKTTYRKGEIDGKKEDFDDDGLLSEEIVFEKGRLRDIKFYDKKGNVISNTTSRKGDANITFYAPDGSKSSDGYYTKDGVLEGKGKYYYKNGSVSVDADYKKGLLDGIRKEFYANGKIKQEGRYKENNADGYFTDYYINGEVMGEGWYVEGQKQGTFIERNLKGNITSKFYYLDNDLNGIAEYYYPSGKLNYQAFYKTGWLYKIIQYDTTGTILHVSELDKGNGKLVFLHHNGTPYIESEYKNYKRHGMYKITNGDGSKASISYYKYGEEDSTYTAWYPNGKLRTEGVYKNGNKYGKWKYYIYEGTISALENYDEDGLATGTFIQYNEDATVDKEINYKNGQTDGETKTFADKDLVVSFQYKAGVLKGYSYKDKTGKMVPPIPIEKGSGHVTAYFSNGNKSLDITFNEFQAYGKRIIYYPNGKEYVNSERIAGDDHGRKVVYYPNGKIMKEENFYYGTYDGLQKYYDQNGNLISEQNYYLDELHGESKHYTNGKLTATYIYYFGELESKK